MIEAHKIPVERTAHYYTFGKATKQTKYCWIVCHGYGQLASKIIHKFDGLGEDHFVVAPEALSSFYWKRPIIGASWMTRKDRLDEIADYTKYIKGLYEEYIPQCADDVQIILFGFSQGCATQIRWLMREFPVFHKLVLWAGLLPEDLDYTPHQDYFLDKDFHWFIGDEDEFINKKIYDWHIQFAKKQGLSLQITDFKGKHEIDRTILANFVKSIESSNL